MAAYVVLTREHTKDQSELETYGKMAGATFQGHRMTPRVFYNKHEVAEGSPLEGIVILEFPTYEEATAWYRSGPYQEASKYRKAGADWRVVIVDGVAPKV